jgi:hypothetical protein
MRKELREYQIYHLYTKVYVIYGQRPGADWCAAGMFVQLADSNDCLMLLDCFDILCYCAC